MAYLVSTWHIWLAHGKAPLTLSLLICPWIEREPVEELVRAQGKLRMMERVFSATAIHGFLRVEHLAWGSGNVQNFKVISEPDCLSGSFTGEASRLGV
jgi:hypothetical protein